LSPRERLTLFLQYMNDQILKEIVREISPLLVGKLLGKVYQLSRTTLVIDFRTNDGRYLLISIDPSQPRLHMISRTMRELEKSGLPSSAFIQVIRKHLGSATLTSVSKDEDDRIVRFAFSTRDIIGNLQRFFLVAQLTGKAANLFLCNEELRVIDSLRDTHGAGQNIGSIYQPPKQPSKSSITHQLPFTQGSKSSLSEAADNYYRNLEDIRDFNNRASTISSRIKKSIDRNIKLQNNLKKDLETHGEAEHHKRIGDLLLSNISTAERFGSIVKIKDYYSENAPTIELEIDENKSLTEEANRRFTQYTKAKKAAQEIARRLKELNQELEVLQDQRRKLDRIIEEQDHIALEQFDRKPKDKKEAPASNRKKQPEKVQGARQYQSSDGYEILVGRGAQDNDRLTFHVARPHDLWLHAANYPGSHVIVRNHGRSDIPHRTIIEAAQLAAYYSQARNDSKVDVHYTQRKFISKPKGSAPGLVRMSSFRTLIVEPKESVIRIVDKKNIKD
jgi:predicted ribosome quality control (RQC) complex YloA/Tae2 family protein